MDNLAKDIKKCKLLKRFSLTITVISILLVITFVASIIYGCATLKDGNSKVTFIVLDSMWAFISAFNSILFMHAYEGYGYYLEYLHRREIREKKKQEGD